MRTTNGIVGVHEPRFIPILFIALLVLTGAAAVVYGIATAFTGLGPNLTGKLLQTTNNADTTGSSATQFCENQTSTTG